MLLLIFTKQNYEEVKKKYAFEFSKKQLEIKDEQNKDITNKDSYSIVVNKMRIDTVCSSSEAFWFFYIRAKLKRNIGKDMKFVILTLNSIDVNNGQGDSRFTSCLDSFKDLRKSFVQETINILKGLDNDNSKKKQSK